MVAGIQNSRYNIRSPMADWENGHQHILRRQIDNTNGELRIKAHGFMGYGLIWPQALPSLRISMLTNLGGNCPAILFGSNPDAKVAK